MGKQGFKMGFSHRVPTIKINAVSVFNVLDKEHGYAAREFTVGTDSYKPKMKSSRKSHNR